MKDNILLLVIFIAVTALVFMRSYFFGAYISPDSTNYLRAAVALRDGYGFHVNAAAGDEQAWFAIWPIGYPAMIALVSFITGTEIYLASKILTVIFLAVIFAMLSGRFGKQAWVYALVVANLGFLQIFWYTWSEQSFILGLLWLSFSITDILRENRIRPASYISVGLVMLFLFFSRYIGAFSVGVTGLLMLYCLVSGISRGKTLNVKKGLLLLLDVLAAAAVMIACLYINKIKSGYATGLERMPINDNPLVLFMRLCIAQIREMQNVFSSFFTISEGISIVVCALLVIVVFMFLRRQRGQYQKYISPDAFVFFAVGLLYWCSIVAMRFSSQFDGFSYRLLFPASALFELAAVSIILKMRPTLVGKLSSGHVKWLTAAVIAAALFSHSLEDVYRAARAIYKHEPIAGYRETRAAVERDVAQVPPRSLVIIAGWPVPDRYINFVRPDVIMIDTGWPKRFEENLLQIEQAQTVYLYVNDWQNLPSDESLRAFFTKYMKSGERLVRIK